MAVKGMGLFGRCCCEVSCDIYEDDFEDGSFAADWTVESGSWSLANSTIPGSFELTATGDAIIVANATNPDGALGSVSAVFQLPGDTTFPKGICTLIGGYLDSDNYVYLRITRNVIISANTLGWTFDLWKREAGVDTQLSSTTVGTGSSDPNVRIATTLCVGSGTISGFAVGTSGTPASASVSGAGYGNKAGVGSIATAGGSFPIYADSFIYRRFAGTCTCP